MTAAVLMWRQPERLGELAWRGPDRTVMLMAARGQTGAIAAVFGAPYPLTAEAIDDAGGDPTARSFLPGALSAGAWRPVTGLPRLLLNGTGTVTIDARNRAGTVTTAVYSTTLASAVNQIDFPYFGDDAVEIRAAYTDSASAEIV